MIADSLRSWLDYLKQSDRVATVERTVSPKFELAAVAKHLDGKKAVTFKRVEGYDMPVVVGIVANRRWIAEACQTDEYELIHKFTNAAANPLPCRHVEGHEAPVKEHVITQSIDLLKALPIPVHHEHDSGSYITAGLLIVRDPKTRKQNVAIHRLQVSGPDKLGVLLLPRHTNHLFKQAEAQGEALECAIVIGADPITMLTSQASTPFGVDELEISSALRGSPLPLVRCETVDVDVPANAEIVIEGRILPNVRAPEGPFGEFPKYYGPQSDKEVIQVSAITHRNEAMFHTIIPAGYEHLWLGGIPREASLYETIRQTVPTVKGVHMTPGGTCRYHAVVSIRKTQDGQGKNVVFAAFANSFDIKHVVVVDEDVDIFNPEEVEWAIATRFQAEGDLVLVHGTQGSKLDPSTHDGVGSKMGLDCTVPLDSEGFRYKRIRIPGYEDVSLEDYGL
ncbi:UbiD family decarboxylase [Alicyclobacillus suci]|uniref:UbiD family decarboxylase n=1 Tax=Alicyclobacillus suci TaxID=2816080 RepID=UPI001A8DCAAD|nr:UbiD family decarboxylase [Alicyclobacillus suci]